MWGLFHLSGLSGDNLEKSTSGDGKDGSLGGKTKDIVALTVSIMSGCDYCIGVYNEAVKYAGLDDKALLELYEVIDLYTGLNRLNIGLQTEADVKTLAWLWRRKVILENKNQ